MALRLYNFFRNSAGHRVRIALALKELDYDYVSVNLRPGSAEHLTPEQVARNPQRLIPALEHDGQIIAQSIAIIDYLEELKPAPSLYPEDPVTRAQAKAFALAITSEAHPLNNLRVLLYLGQELKLSDAQRDAWFRHWADQAMSGLEKTLEARDGNTQFAFADYPTVAEICLAAQATRMSQAGMTLDAYPQLKALNEKCAALPAFQKAAPEAQPDHVAGM